MAPGTIVQGSMNSVGHAATEPTDSIVSTNGVHPESDSEPPRADSADEFTTRSERHLVELKEFQERLNTATSSILAGRKAYRKVVAIITVWHQAPGLEHLAERATELHDLFQEVYGFQTQFYAIPQKARLLDLSVDLAASIREVYSDSDSLLIFYYGGHGVEGNTANTMLIKPENRRDVPGLDFTTAQRNLFSGIQCQMLFLLDCCHAGAMIDGSIDWQNATELLGASSLSATASSRRDSSFTRALVEELKKPGYDIWMLWATLCERKNMDKHGLTVSPWYYDYTGRQHPPISMKKLGDTNAVTPDLVARAQGCSDARMLIKVTFRSDAESFLSDWKRFLKHSPTDVAEYKFAARRNAELVALFESNSCTALITLPIWLWAGMMANADGYQALAIVRSDNFVDQHFLNKGLIDIPSGTEAQRTKKMTESTFIDNEIELAPLPVRSPLPKLPSRRATREEPQLQRAVPADSIERPQSTCRRTKPQNEVNPDKIERKIGMIGKPMTEIQKMALDSGGSGVKDANSARQPNFFRRKFKTLPVAPPHRAPKVGFQNVIMT